MSFIDTSYFVGELNIPNTDQPAVAERLTWFIEKYETDFLQKLLGYPLYKDLMAGLNVVAPATPDPKWLNILYGAEYTDLRGYTQKWKGLIVTDTPIYNLSGGYVYKVPQYLTVGTTAGLIAGSNTATFDGTGGKDDWRGWTPILTRSSILVPGTDYSWDPVLGLLTLLRVGDKFNNAESLFVQFQLRTDYIPVPGMTVNESCIAQYIYYKFRKDATTQFTGIGEVIASAENSVNANPRKRIASVWNEMHCWCREFIEFMQATMNTDATIYPDWTNYNKYDALKYFGFMNPFF